MSHPDSPRRIFPVGWDELHRNSKLLAWRLLDKKDQFKGIIAITRGGLIPAGIIARELDIRLIDTFCISSYSSAAADEAAQGEAQILKGFDFSQGGEGWLVIDELVDTGRTIAILRQHAPKAHYATVYSKPAGRDMVDTYVTEVSQDTWIQFPWDTEAQYATPIVEQR